MVLPPWCIANPEESAMANPVGTAVVSWRTIGGFSFGFHPRFGLGC